MSGPGYHHDVGRIVRLADQGEGTWSAGSTRELSKFPPYSDKRAANFFYYAGTATIERDADYSPFSGYNRIHMPIAGNGLVLKFKDPEEELSLGTFDQHLFAGDKQVRAELNQGPVTAFNLMIGSSVIGSVHALPVDIDPRALDLGLQTSSVLPCIQSDRILYAPDGPIVVTLDDRREVTLTTGDAFVLSVDRSKHTKIPTISLKGRAGSVVILACIDISSTAHGAI